MMNNYKIEKVNKHIEELIKWNKLEENILRHKAKIGWLRLGDGNNSYFHASLKSKHNAKSMRALHKDDGTIITTQIEIEEKMFDYYGGLMGKSDNNLIHVDVATIKEGDQLSMEQRYSLVALINEQEILFALNGICDMNAPNIDGYIDRFFKASWKTIKSDVIAAVMDFFQNERLYKAFNCTMVTLIPKSE